MVQSIVEGAGTMTEKPCNADNKPKFSSRLWTSLLLGDISSVSVFSFSSSGGRFSTSESLSSLLIVGQSQLFLFQSFSQKKSCDFTGCTVASVLGSFSSYLSRKAP